MITLSLASTHMYTNVDGSFLPPAFAASCQNVSSWPRHQGYVQRRTENVIQPRTLFLAITPHTQGEDKWRTLAMFRDLIVQPVVASLSIRSATHIRKTEKRAFTLIYWTMTSKGSRFRSSPARRHQVENKVYLTMRCRAVSGRETPKAIHSEAIEGFRRKWVGLSA